MVRPLRSTATLLLCIALPMALLGSAALASDAAESLGTATDVVRRQPLKTAAGEAAYAFAGLSYLEGFGREWAVVGFYYLGGISGAANRETKPAYVARMIRGGPKGQTRERWTSAAVCPALLTSLKEMTSLRAPPLAELPGPLASEASLPELRFDPSVWRVWGVGREEGTTSELIGAEFETTGPSTIGRWAASTLQRLAPCWTEKRPL